MTAPTISAMPEMVSRWMIRMSGCRMRSMGTSTGCGAWWLTCLFPLRRHLGRVGRAIGDSTSGVGTGSGRPYDRSRTERLVRGYTRARIEGVAVPAGLLRGVEGGVGPLVEPPSRRRARHLHRPRTPRGCRSRGSGPAAVSIGASARSRRSRSVAPSRSRGLISGRISANSSPPVRAASSPRREPSVTCAGRRWPAPRRRRRGRRCR